MAVKSSGQISLTDIQTEFGGSNPIGIGEYYRGGSYVTNWSGASGVPTSGAISASDFYGARQYPTLATYNQAGAGDMVLTGLGSNPKMLVIVGSAFSSGTISIPAPTVGGAATTKVIYRYNGNLDDGHVAAVWTYDLGTADSATVNLAFANTWTVIVVDNVTSLTTVATGYTNSSAAVSIATSAQGFAVAAGVNNFSGIGTTITNCDTTYQVGYATINGIDSATTGATTSYQASGSRVQLNIAASFGYN